MIWSYFNFSSYIAVTTLRAKFNLLSAVPSIELHPQHIVPVSKTAAVSMVSAITTIMSIWATFWNNETGVAGGGGEDVQPSIARGEAKKNMRRPVNTCGFNIMAFGCETDETNINFTYTRFVFETMTQISAHLNTLQAHTCAYTEYNHYNIPGTFMFATSLMCPLCRSIDAYGHTN